MLASSDIGLALGRVVENTPQSTADVDGLLVSAARRLDPDGQTDLEWTFEPEEGTVTERLAALASRRDRESDLQELDLTLRNTHFLRAAAVLREWARAERTPTPTASA